MSPGVKKWIKFSLRWGVAVLGVAWVISNLSLRDTVTIVDPVTQLPVSAALTTRQSESAAEYQIIEPKTGNTITISAREIVTRPDRRRVTLPDGQTVKLLAVKGPKLLVEDPTTHHGRWVTNSDVAGGFVTEVTYPRVEIGLIRMVHQANTKYLWLAVLIFPLTFIITAFRWHELLKALGINMGVALAFVLSMVGAFYNTFLPGSTGGDVFKAIYAARQAPDKRTRAVMSVVVDRAIGLLALIILGGSMAAFQWQIPECRRVAIGAMVIIGGTILSLTIFYTPILRRIFLIDFILARLPMQKQVTKAVEVMEIYRRRPMLVFFALIATFPVHITVIVSAAFAGRAFGLPIAWTYYWVVVPVIVLAAAIPISPQGAGVMEFFAVKLTETRGCTVGQALALTMSVRMVQIIWNLAGGIFVLRGGFHAPTAAERHELDVETPVASTAASI
jgi:uncharacterized protein (TIRG00374 family)